MTIFSNHSGSLRAEVDLAEVNLVFLLCVIVSILFNFLSIFNHQVGRTLLHKLGELLRYFAIFYHVHSSILRSVRSGAKSHHMPVPDVRGYDESFVIYPLRRLTYLSF